MCRVSTQTSGKSASPSALNALNSHSDNGPASSPIGLKGQAEFLSTVSKASRSLAILTSRVILPVSSTMQREMLLPIPGKKDKEAATKSTARPSGRHRKAG
jgi:hypothetical protein